jgi:hypothetical protein
MAVNLPMASRPTECDEQGGRPETSKHPPRYEKSGQPVFAFRQSVVAGWE